MVLKLFKLYMIYFILMIAKDIVLPSSSWVKGVVVQSNESVCVIQPIEGTAIVAEAYYYCPVGQMVSAQIMVKEDATEFESGIRINTLTVLVGL